MTIKCYIFDIDGTIANTDHRKHHLEQRPKNWDGWHAEAKNDTPHFDIIKLAQIIEAAGFAIVLCSGRNEAHRWETTDWCVRHDVPLDGLFMRPDNDFRDDSIIKRELLARIRAEGFDPIMAFDDRDRVVAMWRDEGIRCLQVAPGDF